MAKTGFLMTWLINIIFLCVTYVRPYYIFVCNISTDKNISYLCVTNVRTLHIFLCIFIIRIFNGCEVRIENFVTRVVVRHREACRVMPNNYPEWRNFQFTPNNYYGFIFLHTLPSTFAFRLEYVLFNQFYAEITIFFNQEIEKEYDFPAISS